MNAYHACSLYGLITEDEELTSFSQLMLAMEIQSIKHYWHIPSFEVYDEVLGASSRVIGNVGVFDVTASTWFGSKVEYVHGINMYVDDICQFLFDCCIRNTNVAVFVFSGLLCVPECL